MFRNNEPPARTEEKHDHSRIFSYFRDILPLNPCFKHGRLLAQAIRLKRQSVQAD